MINTPRNAIAIHLWGRQIKPDAEWIADEALDALRNAGFTINPPHSAITERLDNGR